MLATALLFVIISGLIEWYTYAGLKSRWFDWNKYLRKTIKVLFLSLLILSIVSFIMMLTTGKIFDPFMLNFWFSFFIWNLLIKVSLAIFLIIDDLRRVSIYTSRKIKSKERSQISRSEFLVKAGATTAALPFFGLGWGMLAGPYRYRVFKEKINLPNLPSSFNGLKIVQISDIHAGSFYNSDAVERGIDMILDQKPDVIFFTGDLVNDRAVEMEPYLELFKKIQAPLGVYSIMGNHDYGDYASWNSEEEKAKNHKDFIQMHERLGWNLLLNEHVYLEKGLDKIAIIGVENWGKNFIQKGDIKKAHLGCDAPIKILLSHDPTYFDEVIKKEYPDIDITFSGHTHGAQIGIETAGFKWSPASLRYGKWAGLYPENGQYLYINRGFGFIGYAGRLGIMPEITLMELTT